MTNLRKNLIKIAYANPGPVRDALLPLLEKTANITRLLQEFKRNPEDLDLLEAIRSQLIRRVTNQTKEGGKGDNGSIRWQRFRGSIRIWEVANAGKRGKNARTFVIYELPEDALPGGAFSLILANELPMATYDSFVARAKEIKGMVDKIKRLPTGLYLYSPQMEEKEVKGVDVPKLPIQFTNRHDVFIRVDKDGFAIGNRSPSDPNQMTMGDGYGYGKRMGDKMYNWVANNQDKLENMTYEQIRKELDKGKISYREYAAMD